MKCDIEFVYSCGVLDSWKEKHFSILQKKLVQMRDEPALRSAVSRSYYAAYNFCIQLLDELGFHFGKDSPAHEKVYQYLNNAGITEIEATADDLRLLRKHRNIADTQIT